jgi:hypothetical protein
MATATWKGKPLWLLIRGILAIATCTVLIFTLKTSTMPVSADPGVIFGPGCGKAVMDGNVNPVEWSTAATQTFQMVSPGGADPFTATLYVMNSGHFLYMGITINDDEFSTVGEFLPQGDGFRIDFDNDHSGTLFTLGDDVLSIVAGLPQFADNYIYAATSAQADTAGGGTSDGAGAASRVGELNHFELRHPLCSGDSLDFCLHPGDTVGFRLEYLDAQANGSFGSSQYFPSVTATSEADIVIGQCSIPDFFIQLPLISR